jgi:hypothetical protein
MAYQGMADTVNRLRQQKKALVPIDALGALQVYNPDIDALGALQEYTDNEVSSVQGWKQYFKGMMSNGKVKAAVLLSVLIPTVVKIMGLYSALPVAQKQQALDATKLLFNNQTMCAVGSNVVEAGQCPLPPLKIASLAPVFDILTGWRPAFKSNKSVKKVQKKSPKKSKKSPKKSKKSPKKSQKKSPKKSVKKSKKSPKKH